MSYDALALLGRFADTRVLVVGDAMLDLYLEGRSRGLCREAPAPVVTLAERRAVPGGAANTAANARCLGGRTTLLAPVGGDAEAALLRTALAEAGVEADGLVDEPGRRTIAKQRIVADGQILARLDQGSTDPVPRGVEEALVAGLRDRFAAVDAVVVSDYGCGAVTPRVRAAVAELSARHPDVVVVVDAHDLAPYEGLAPTAVKPNYDEAVRLLGLRPLDGPGRVEQMELHGERVLERTGARLAAVTVDQEGALLFEAGRAPFRSWAEPAAHSRATGAGDTFVAALTLALAAGGSPRVALEVASGAAAVVIDGRGTATCPPGALRARLAGAEKRVNLDQLRGEVDAHRRSGRRVVFTNGVFDLLHRGHVGYLSKAKALGDVLVVGVNSDESVRRLKGPERPVCPLPDRLRVLAALSCVDYLVAFEGDSPTDAIEAVRPDIYVKGGDYEQKVLPEAPLVRRLGGTIHLLPYEDESTTAIIERIRGGGPPGTGAGDAAPVVDLTAVHEVAPAGEE